MVYICICTMAVKSTQIKWTTFHCVEGSSSSIAMPWFMRWQGPHKAEKEMRPLDQHWKKDKRYHGNNELAILELMAHTQLTVTSSMGRTGEKSTSTGHSSACPCTYPLQWTINRMLQHPIYTQLTPEEAQEPENSACGTQQPCQPRDYCE